jgi:nucleoside 2-deoxyribosyltransferase
MSDPGRPRCYVASPLGFTEAGRDYYVKVFLPALADVVTPVDPWTLSDPTDAPLEIGRRNADAITSCQLLAAHLDGQEVDSGTAAEIGYAAAKGLRCFGLRTDLRESGEPGVAVNLQVEHFIVASGGRIATSLDDLVDALSSAATSPPAPTPRAGRASSR